MRFLPCVVLFVAVGANAQSINISNFYYRDYLDFGQNKGVFKEVNTTLTGKDGTNLTIPQIPNFAASSNYGSLTSIGRGFAVTANHVGSPEGAVGLLDWGLTKYSVTKEDALDCDNCKPLDSISKIYGYDTKFYRLNKYVVEGQVGMLDIDNTKTKDTNESENIKKFTEQLEKFKDDKGNIYLYQSGSGIVRLRGTNNTQEFYTDETGERKGGGFGTLGKVDYYNDGMAFYYHPMTGFYNQITSGDSGSGIYAYDKDKGWILLGVVSRDNGAISVASNKDFMDYQSKFEHKIDLQSDTKWTLTNLRI